MTGNAPQFKYGKIVENYGDFICVTYILCVLACWKILKCS